MTEIDKIRALLNYLIDQELEYIEQNNAKFNKDRCGLINSLGEFIIAKQQRATFQQSESDRRFIIESPGNEVLFTDLDKTITVG